MKAASTVAKASAHPRVSTPKATPAAPFKEAEFVAEFMALLKTDKTEAALRYMLEQGPRLFQANLNFREKHNHLLFMTRLLQSGSNAKYGPQKLLRKAAEVVDSVKGHVLPPETSFLDFGCGAHDPIALSSYFYMNGFKRAIACDLLAPRNPIYSALSMYDILANVRAFPSRYRMKEVGMQDFIGRWRAFDIGAFEKGDFDTGVARLAGKVDYRVEDLTKLEIATGELGLVASFAVFEHVDDLAGVNAWLHARTAPGGLHHHFIDLADHRSYSPGSGVGPFGFLTEDQPPRGLNRVRASEHVAAFEAAGFEVVKAHPTRQDMSAEVRARLRAPWKQMSDADQTTTKLKVVLRKPASV